MTTNTQPSIMHYADLQLYLRSKLYNYNMGRIIELLYQNLSVSSDIQFDDVSNTIIIKLRKRKTLNFVELRAIIYNTIINVLIESNIASIIYNDSTLPDATKTLFIDMVNIITLNPAIQAPICQSIILNDTNIMVLL